MKHLTRPQDASESLRLFAGAMVICVSLTGGCEPTVSVQAQAIPTFTVPGHQREMQLLGRLFALHHSPRTSCTLWDAWLPMSVLWPAVGEEMSAEPLRQFYRQSFLSRPVSSDGYVNMLQHRGLAHPAGWPFPTWTQSGGVGWHFTYHGNPYGQQLGPPPAKPDGWQLEGGRGQGVDGVRGWRLTLDSPRAVLTSPEFQISPLISPFVIIKAYLSELPDTAEPYLEWTTTEELEFSATRRVAIPREPARTAGDLSLLAVPVYRHPEWKGTITRLLIGWDNPEAVKLDVAAIHSGIDSRHPITGSLFVRGSCDYFNWTGDVEFLRANIERMRRAIDYSIREFDVREQGCVLVSWVGHDGRAGFAVGPDGQKRLFHGRGVGNNYWDLLPFGHQDCLATIYFYDALNGLAALEREIAQHPQWNVTLPPDQLSHQQLTSLASKIRETSTELFWNDETGRFVACIDADGVAHDYGFTFVNLEAIHYGLATEDQAKQILAWMDGERLVAGDTSQRSDIYHWRFGPRSTTRRNVDWYAWVWSNPEQIPWGGQVQDGGAVLGFSYFDLMARLRVLGPDNAWQRLSEMLEWFADVEQAGGYRKYYNSPERGTLQGGGTPGGLGIEHEFMESVLVPQVMLYGFLGMQPSADGFSLDPQLPSAWPSLGISRIHVHDHVLDVAVAQAGRITITSRRPGETPLRVTLPGKRWSIARGPAKRDEHGFLLRHDKPGDVVEFIAN